MSEIIQTKFSDFFSFKKKERKKERKDKKGCYRKSSARQQNRFLSYIYDYTYLTLKSSALFREIFFFFIYVFEKKNWH